jgi:hypothetical protein
MIQICTLKLQAKRCHECSCLHRHTPRGEDSRLLYPGEGPMLQRWIGSSCKSLPRLCTLLVSEPNRGGEGIGFGVAEVTRIASVQWVKCVVTESYMLTTPRAAGMLRGIRLRGKRRVYTRFPYSIQQGPGCTDGITRQRSDACSGEVRNTTCRLLVGRLTTSVNSSSLKERGLDEL